MSNDNLHILMFTVVSQILPIKVTDYDTLPPCVRACLCPSTSTQQTLLINSRRFSLQYDSMSVFYVGYVF